MKDTEIFPHVKAKNGVVLIKPRVARHYRYQSFDMERITSERTEEAILSVIRRFSAVGDWFYIVAASPSGGRFSFGDMCWEFYSEKRFAYPAEWVRMKRTEVRGASCFVTERTDPDIWYVLAFPREIGTTIRSDDVGSSPSLAVLSWVFANVIYKKKRLEENASRNAWSVSIPAPIQRIEDNYFMSGSKTPDGEPVCVSVQGERVIITDSLGSSEEDPRIIKPLLEEVVV
ncbi:MAG TPA: hypothetical protein VN420_02080 [Candidatus Fimivivens sp.]|nr:hypothetical protein [Candidatus Fimivivens sp.]